MELSRQRKSRKRRERTLSKIQEESGRGSDGESRGDGKKGDVVVVGASVLDWTAKILTPHIMVSGVWEW